MRNIREIGPIYNQGIRIRPSALIIQTIPTGGVDENGNGNAYHYNQNPLPCLCLRIRLFNG